MEKPVIFINRRGESLFGVTFAPDYVPVKKQGILICLSSIKYRVGPFRMYIMLARQLCGLGYHVMYFDPAGIGDSEGEFEEKPLTEHHVEIQNGKFTNDINDAVTFFQSQFRLDDLVLYGLCGGALAALIEAASDERIAGLMLLAIPVLYDIEEKKGEVFDETSVITSEVQSTQILSDLLRKMLQFQTWRKAFSLKIAWRYELKIIFRALSILWTKMREKILKLFAGEKEILFEDQPVSTHPRFNFVFQRSFYRFVSRGGKILFIFADTDFVTWVFKSEFQDRALFEGNPYESRYEIHILKEANHIFSGRKTQGEMMDLMRNWLEINYPLT